MSVNSKEDKQYVLFGCGHFGQIAAVLLGKNRIRNFVDNDCSKWGKKVLGIEVISPDLLKAMSQNYQCIISLAQPAADDVGRQLSSMGIEYRFFDKKELENRQRLIFYSHPYNIEDVIIYDVLKNEKDIFYIDVGCNDPFSSSVTKLLYDMLDAKGLNIDSFEEVIEVTRRERPRDICVYMGVGEHKGELKIYAQGELSNSLIDHVRAGDSERCVSRRTLVQICNEYLSDLIDTKRQIHLLKLNREGFEGAVIKGADWRDVRPWIVLIESAEPGALIPAWQECESDLLSHGYHFVMMAGVNRYYVANEHKDLDSLFLSPDELCLKYRLFQASKNEIYSIPQTVIPPAKQIRLAYELEGVIPLAVYTCGGLGDTIVIKRKVDEVMKWDKNIVVDVYGPENLLEVRRSFYTGEYQGRMNAVVGGGEKWYEIQRSKYAVALNFNVDLDVDIVDEKKLHEYPILLERCRRLKAQSNAYGKFTSTNFAIHYARCAKDQLNNYTSCNRYEGFYVKDFHTHIPMKASLEAVYSKLYLGKYITFNVGQGEVGLENGKMQAKAWPLSYFSEFVHLFKRKYPDIKIIQTGSANLPHIAGCDKYVMGEDLELVKYLLKGAVFHFDIEGGLVHLATQLGTTCIVLFGPTPLAYYGYSNNINLQAGNCHNCYWLVPNCYSCYRQLAEPECMYAIKPEMVIESVERYFKNTVYHIKKCIHNC